MWTQSFAEISKLAEGGSACGRTLKRQKLHASAVLTTNVFNLAWPWVHQAYLLVANHGTLNSEYHDDLYHWNFNIFSIIF
jgi:hypothetical protein